MLGQARTFGWLAGWVIVNVSVRSKAVPHDLSSVEQATAGRQPSSCVVDWPRQAVRCAKRLSKLRTGRRRLRLCDVCRSSIVDGLWRSRSAIEPSLYARCPAVSPSARAARVAATTSDASLGRPSAQKSSRTKRLAAHSALARDHLFIWDTLRGLEQIGQPCSNGMNVKVNVSERSATGRKTIAQVG